MKFTKALTYLCFWAWKSEAKSVLVKCIVPEEAFAYPSDGSWFAAALRIFASVDNVASSGFTPVPASSDDEQWLACLY